MQMSTDLISRR